MTIQDTKFTCILNQLSVKAGALPKGGCVYAIRHLHSRQVYIGKTKQFEKRALAHLHSLERKVHPNLALLEAFTRHGGSEFCIEVLEWLPDNGKAAHLRDRELWWLKKEMTENTVFNGDKDIRLALTGRPFLGDVRFPPGSEIEKDIFSEMSETERGELIVRALRNL